MSNGTRSNNGRAAKAGRALDKVFIGGYVPPALKEKIGRVATAQSRSFNAQMEIFLVAGVAHLKAKQSN